jgi:hypothetical protein
VQNLYEISFIRENVRKPFRQVTYQTGKDLEEAIEQFKKKNPCVKIVKELCFKCAE